MNTKPTVELSITRTKFYKKVDGAEGANGLAIDASTKVVLAGDKTVTRRVRFLVTGPVTLRGEKPFEHLTEWVYPSNDLDAWDVPVGVLLREIDPLQNEKKLTGVAFEFALKIDAHLTVGFRFDGKEDAHEFLLLEDTGLGIVREVRFEHYGTFRAIHGMISYALGA